MQNLPEQGEESQPRGGSAAEPTSAPVVVPHRVGTETIWQALSTVVDPELGTDVVTLGMVRDVELVEGVARIAIALTTAACPLRGQLQRDVEAVAQRTHGVDRVETTTSAMDHGERAALMSRARKAAQERAELVNLPAGVRVLGIVSGKGGVGKSSVSVNLAVALAERGLRVGLLDADIWGFSIPRMLGVEGSLEVRNKRMIPHEVEAGAGIVKVVSMGFLSSEDDAIMWRGLMLSRAVQHFLEDVDWGSIDYLVVDMPPGTGDVQMGLARMVPGCELIIVTTPALGAQKVAGRAADMARRGHLRVAGVIENMAGFTADDGTTYALFGSGGGARLADETGVPLLASIPIDASVAAGGDSGRPVASDPASPLHPVFAALAARIHEEVAPVGGMEGCSARMIDNLRSALAAKTG